MWLYIITGMWKCNAELNIISGNMWRGDKEAFGT